MWRSRMVAYCSRHAVFVALTVVCAFAILSARVNMAAATEADMVLARVQAMHDIRNLKARYFLCLDSKDWECFRSVFTDDFQFRVFEPDEDEPRSVLEGPDRMVAATSKTVEGAVTVHHGHEPLIELLEDGTARAKWPAEGLMRRNIQGRVVTRHAFNVYRETYRQEDGQWKISSSDLVRNFYEWRREDQDTAKEF